LQEYLKDYSAKKYKLASKDKEKQLQI